MSIRRSLFALTIFAVCAVVSAGAASAASTRVVTLIPSLTEDAFALGVDVVGVSKFSADIPQARGVPRVGDFEGIDVERIIALAPNVVFAIPSQERFLKPLERAGVRVVLLPDDSYDDIFADIREIGAATGRSARARAVIRAMQAQTARLVASERRRRERPRVFIALETGPIWTAGRGSYLGRLIELAGGRNAADDLLQPWGEYTAEALLRKQPDAIVTGTDTHLRDVLGREPWRSLRAVREGHVFIVPNARIQDALFRPGPRYNEGLRWLIERLSSL